MSIEEDLKDLTAGLLNNPGGINPNLGHDPSFAERRLRGMADVNAAHAASYTSPPAPPRPTGGTVLEALEKLQAHAVAILNDAKELETELTGQPVSNDSDDGQRQGGGIWGRIAGQIVMIERVFAQIDETHHNAIASLK